MTDSALDNKQALIPKVTYETLTVTNERSIAQVITGLKYDLYLEGRKLRNNYKRFEHFSGDWEWVLKNESVANMLWAKKEGFEQSHLEHLLALSEQFPHLQKKKQIRTCFMKIEFATKAIALSSDRLDFIPIAHAGDLKVLYVRRFSKPLPFAEV